MTGKNNYYTINSLIKAFEVIETMTMQQQWELAALSRQTGLPKTTVHRIILTLEELGYVAQQKERGLYELTFKLPFLGSRVAENSDVVEIARPYCRELRDSTDETVNLCTLSNTNMLVMDRQQSRQMLRQDSIVGSSFSCFFSASGKTYMAFMEPEDLDRLLDKIRIEAKGTITSKHVQELTAELKNIHKTGVGYDYEEVFSGVRCIASPIFNQQRKIVATVGVSAPTVRLDDEAVQKVSSMVLNTAALISKRLGVPFYPVGGAFEK